MQVQNILKNSTEEAEKAIRLLQTPEAMEFMEKVAHILADAFKKGRKLILAGNGGSLCDAAHFAEELTGQFRKYRPALPAIVLNEPAHMTCVGNDFGFDAVFSRGIEAYGKPGDVFIGLTTSGNSPNLIKAFEMAKKRKLITIAFLGKDGGKLAQIADYEWIVSGFKYSDRIQEVHMAAIHIIIEVLEGLLFPDEKHTNELLLQAELITS